MEQAFGQHAEECDQQKERLEQVIDKIARGETCESIWGLLAQLEERVEEFKDSEVADAAELL